MTKRSGYNQLTAEVYSSGTTPIVDAADELQRLEGVQFGTGYPGGLYLAFEGFVPRETRRSWQVQHNQRIVLRNGLRPVYEGVISGWRSEYQGVAYGVRLTAVGKWGDLLMKRRWRKLWADERLDGDTWVYQTGTSGAEQGGVDRLNRIRFTPKAVAWANGDYAAVRYSMPYSETVKRLKYSYDFLETGQVWEISVWRSNDAAAWTQMTNVSGETYTTGTTTVITANGTGSIDVTLGTPMRYLELRFYSRAAQTPAADGTIYGEFSGVQVYSESGGINLTEIAKDVRGKLAELNGDERLIAANTFSLVPFIADRWETMADILALAAGYGDSSYNPWAVGLRHSEVAETPNGEPVLFVEQQPALTDYEYLVNFDDENLAAPLQIDWTLDDLWNYIIVGYLDEVGRQVWLTPDDDAGLKDTASIDRWGQREFKIDVGGQGGASTAKNWAKRFLAQHKDRVLRVSGDIQVVGYIKDKNGQEIPACEVAAGNRVKIGNFLNDVNDTWLTFLVSQTGYNDRTETAALSTGVPDSLAVFLAQRRGR